MQFSGLKNILSPNTAPKESAAGANPTEGLLDALQGGFEGILSDIEASVSQTAEGIGEALAEVPEALAAKIEDLLGAVGDLAEGTPLGSFLEMMGIQAESLGLNNSKEANQFIFNGETFSNASNKTFDLEGSLENLQSKLEAVTQLVKNGIEGEVDIAESLRVFANDLKSVEPASSSNHSKIHNKEMNRPSFFQGGDDFLANREAAAKVKNNAEAEATNNTVVKLANGDSVYAKQAEQTGSMFSKYAKEAEVKNIVLVDANEDQSQSKQQILAEAITGASKSSGDTSAKANTTNVFDMTSVNSAKSSEVIAKIVNYLDQQQLTSKGELDVLVKHDELGQFRLNVNRSGDKGSIGMRISAGGEGHRFFTEHEVELVKALNQNGVRLSDLKIVQAEVIGETGKSSSGAFGDSSQDSSSSQFSQSHQQRGGNNRDGSERRRHLWQEYRERMGASA